MASNEEKPWCRTQYGCGSSGFRGSWMYCDEAGVEKRRANDGILYNVKGFRDFYKNEGKEKWEAAKDYVERRMAKNDKPYTANEFRAYYIDSFGEVGWIKEWEAATPETR